LLASISCGERSHAQALGRSPSSSAIQNCQDSVTSWLQRTGYRRITFENTLPDGTPGRREQIIGKVSGQRGKTAAFSFSCFVDSNSGKLRSFEIHPR
jgi:hypothetical protein